MKMPNLCKPSYVYLLLSIFTIVILYIQNLDNTTIYCVGSHECDVPNTTFIFLINIVYVLFWTWILNLICKEGFTGLSWFLVMGPYLLFFILVSLLMIDKK